MIDPRRLVPLFLRSALRRVQAVAMNASARHLQGRKRINCSLAYQVYGEPGRDVFFGYFDISPFSADGEKVLAHRTLRTHADPKLDDIEVGFYDRRSGYFKPLGQTPLWCWQMGARLRWINAQTVAYNDMVDGRYGSTIVELASGTRSSLRTPIYDISSDGKQGLSLNFSRLQRMRSGYGYSRLPDTTADQAAPASSGVELVDLMTGSARLVVSIAQVAQIEPLPDMVQAEHYLNHLAFSPSGAQFGVFHIWRNTSGQRSNRLLLFDLDGNLRAMVPGQRHISHMAWQSDRRVLAFAAMPGDSHPTYQWIDLEQGQWSPVLDGRIKTDGHPFLSPDGREAFISDTYPDRSSYRSLYLADLTAKTTTCIGTFHSPPRLSGAERCDLHPRWSGDGKYVAVDTAHLGRRSLAVIDLGGVV
jgi:hypothetical protein